jgi:hypothetical protein
MSYLKNKIKSINKFYAPTSPAPSHLPSKIDHIELVQVGPPASPISHFLVLIGDYYYHNNSLDHKVQVMSKAQFEDYLQIHSEISRKTISIKDPKAAAVRLKTSLREGFHFNFLLSNCKDFTDYIIEGKETPKMLMDKEA